MTIGFVKIISLSDLSYEEHIFLIKQYYRKY